MEGARDVWGEGGCSGSPAVCPVHLVEEWILRPRHVCPRRPRYHAWCASVRGATCRVSIQLVHIAFACPANVQTYSPGYSPPLRESSRACNKPGRHNVQSADRLMWATRVRAHPPACEHQPRPAQIATIRQSRSSSAVAQARTTETAAVGPADVQRRTGQQRAEGGWPQPLARVGDRPPVVALGKFDALHRGHRALAAEAAAMGGQPWLVSFSGMAEVLGVCHRAICLSTFCWESVAAADAGQEPACLR